MYKETGSELYASIVHAVVESAMVTWFGLLMYEVLSLLSLRSRGVGRLTRLSIPFEVLGLTKSTERRSRPGLHRNLSPPRILRTQFSY